MLAIYDGAQFFFATESERSRSAARNGLSPPPPRRGSAVIFFFSLLFFRKNPMPRSGASGKPPTGELVAADRARYDLPRRIIRDYLFALNIGAVI